MKRRRRRFTDFVGDDGEFDTPGFIQAKRKRRRSRQEEGNKLIEELLADTEMPTVAAKRSKRNG